jgi:hypothetical protein
VLSPGRKETIELTRGAGEALVSHAPAYENPSPMTPHYNSGSGNNGWQWSNEHGRYYRCQSDGQGGYMRDSAGTMHSVFQCSKTEI